MLIKVQFGYWCPSWPVKIKTLPYKLTNYLLIKNHNRLHAWKIITDHLPLSKTAQFHP